MSIWPAGCVCHAVRAAGANETSPDEAGVLTSGGVSKSTFTLPEKFSAGPDMVGTEPEGKIHTSSIAASAAPVSAIEASAKDAKHLLVIHHLLK